MRLPRSPLLRSEWLVLCLAVLVLLALRLPFLPTTLEDIDSINFDLGVHDYDPVAHRPHPPGYPVYIAVAKLPHGWFDAHATGLAAVSAAFGAVLAIPLYFLFRQLTSRSGAALATVLTLFNPLVWFTSVRPMSDLAGFFIAVSAQCLAFVALPGRRTSWYAAAALAGVAGGVRVQTLLLTIPLLLYGCVRDRWRTPGTVGAFAVGTLAWLVPLVITVGGLNNLLAAFVPVGQDVLAFESVGHRLSLRQLALALIDGFITPWHSPVFAAVMLLAAGLGAGRLASTSPARLGHAFLLFAPYAAYHLLVQDVQTVRYAIPIIPLVAFSAAAAISDAPRPLSIAAASTFVVAASLLTLPALQVYHSTPSPPVQAIAHINAQPGRSVATGHYLFDRHLTLLDPAVERLPPPDEREWRTLTRFWRSGRHEPVWFLRQPKRMTLLLFGRDTQEVVGQWAWPSELQPLLKGARPEAVELVRILPPRWLTEAGFMARFEDRFSGLESGRHRVRLRGSKSARVFIASGTLAPGHDRAQLVLRSGDGILARWDVGATFSLHATIPALAARGYAPVSLESTAAFVISDVWFERTAQPVVRPGRGFYLVEHDEQGRRFRWTSGRAAAITYLPVARARLALVGQAPPSQSLPLTIGVKWNGRHIGALTVNTRFFRYEVDLQRGNGGAWGELTLTISPTFVPDEVSGNGDQRSLGVRVYELTVATLPAQ